MKKISVFVFSFFIGMVHSQVATLLSSNGVFNESFFDGQYGNVGPGDFSPGGYVIFQFGESVSLTEFQFMINTSFNCNNVNVALESAPSDLGPWSSVQITACNLTNVAGIPGLKALKYSIQQKVSKYWKITVNSYDPSVSPAFFVREIEFPNLNNNLISTSSNTGLLNNNCFSLSSIANGEYYQWSTGETTQSINVCQPGNYTCTVTNITFTGNQDHNESIVIASVSSQDNWPAPNGEVYTIHQKGNSIYYGGDFNQVGPVTGSSSLIDGSSGSCNITFPRVYGTVNVTLPDGNGGWYIGGNFTRVGNYTINNLAHINANNTVDLNFKPEPNATVLTLIMNGSYLYAGGSFTTIKGLTNNYIVKLDKTNGDPIFWNAFCNNTVRTMTLYTDKLIIGGDFSSIGGLTRNRLAAVDTNFVQATTWDPNPNAAVYKVFVNGTKLYVGGDFTNIATVAKSRGAGFSLPGFTVDPYDFGANNRIHDFAFFNNVLYTAGTFTTIGGAARNYIAGLNPLNALANSFNATADGIVQTVAIYNGAVIAGGDFSNIGGAVRNRLASLIPTTGLANTWNPNVMGLKGTIYNVLSISSSGGSICPGGTFWGVGSSVRNNVAAIDATTGALLPFDPNANNIVRSINSDATYVYLGGDFTTLNSTVTKNRIAQVNASTGFPTGWNPNADASVNTMVINSGTLYAGGAFGNIGGGARSRIAGLSTTTGAATAFNPSANGNVNTLLISNDTLFTGGAFTTIGGQTRNRIAAYTMSNSTLTAFNPNSNNTVNALAKNGSKLYLGGQFTTVGTTNVSILAQFDLITNSVTALNTGIINSSGLNAVAVQDSSVYIGGGYQNTNCGLPIINSSVVKTLSNVPGHWMPQPDDIVRTIVVGSNKVFLGGRFKVVQSRYQPYFTTADLFFNGATPSFSSTSSNSVCQGQSFTVSGANLSSVTGVTINGISSPFVVSSSSVITVTPNTVVSGPLVLSYPGGSVNTNQNITVNTTVAPTFNQASAICSGSTLSPLPTTSTNNVSGTWSPALNNTATTTYTFTPSTGQCASTTTMTITVNALPTASITAGGSTTICQGASVVLNANTGTGLTYQWKNNGTNISGATAASYTATTSGSYTVVVTNSNGCIKTSTGTTVTVNPLTIPTFTQVSAICSGATLNALPTTSNNSIAGTWSPALNNTTTTTYTFTPSSSAAPTCATTTTMAITVNPLTTPIFTQVPAICSGATLSALPTTSNNSIAGTWSPALNNTTTTTYTFTPASTTSPTCATTTTMAITVNVLPTATITAGGATTFCQGASVVLNANTGSGLTYQWKNNGTNISGATAVSYTASTAGSYTVVVTNSNGCIKTSTATTVTVNPLTTPTFTQVPAICSGATLSALPTTSNNSIAGTWSPALNNTTTTTYTFTPTSTASPTCATTTTMAITVNVLPTATITAGGATTFCQGDSVVLNANTGSGLTYQWKNNGTNIPGATAASYTASTAGSYNVVVINSNSCSKTSTATIVTVNPLTTPTFTQVPSICSGATLSALPTTSNNSIIGTWSPALNNTATTTYSFTPSSAASPTCATITTMTITVNALPTATITAGGTTTFCQGDSVVLNALSDNGNVFQWQENGNNISLATAVNFTALASGSYTVFVTNSINCSATSAAIIVTVNPLTTPTFTQVPAICYGATLNALPTTSNNSIAGSWSPALNNTATTTYSFVPTSLAFPICATPTTMSITVNPLPVVTLATFNQFCDTLGLVTLSGGAPSGGVYSGTSVSNNSFNTAIGSGTYPITYNFSNNNGCSSNATQNLTVIDCSGVGFVELTENEISIYPNPTDNIFTIEVSEFIIGQTFAIFDIRGRLLLNGNLNETKTLINVSSFATGTYYVNLPESNKMMKIIKQ